MQRQLSFTLLLSGLVLASSAWGQGQAWRCPGNVYTNNPAEAKSIGGCTPLNEDTVTIIPGEPVSQTTDDTAARPTEQPSAAPPAGQTNEGQPSEESRAQTEMLRAQMQAQLAQKQQELAQLQVEYNNGEPQRMGPEFRNYQLYLNRVERLKNEIAQKQQEIAELQYQLTTL